MSDSCSPSDGVIYSVCELCGCVLNDDNRSPECVNVCRSCKRSLDF